MFLTKKGTVLYCTVLYCTVLCCAVLCCAVLCCAVLCCAVLCCAVLCCAVLCCAVLCCAVLYCTLVNEYFNCKTITLPTKAGESAGELTSSSKMKQIFFRRVKQIVFQ